MNFEFFKKYTSQLETTKNTTRAIPNDINCFIKAVLLTSTEYIIDKPAPDKNKADNKILISIFLNNDLTKFINSL
jgi:hypothetical protein